MSYFKKQDLFSRFERQKEAIKEKSNNAYDGKIINVSNVTIEIKYNSHKERYFVFKKKSYFNINALHEAIIQR